MGHRRTLTRLLAVLAMLLAVALTASCIPPQEPNPPDDPPVDEEPGDDDDDPPLPVEQMVIELQTPIPGYTAPMTVDTTTGHVVQLTELTGGDIAPQCFGTVGDNSMCLGAFQPQQPIVIQGEATTDRLLKAGGESIPALQWLVDEAVQAVAVLHDLPVDARIERYARPQIRTYMVTRLLDILDKAAYGEQLTADEQRALEFLQRQVLEEDRILTRYAYEEHERFVRESCAYVPPPAPAFVTEPVPVPAAWQSWCAMHGVGYGALWPPPMPPVEVFQTWGMYRAASQLGLDVLNSPEMQAHLGAVARAGTMAAGVVAAVGTGALAYSLVGANAALATAIFVVVIAPMLVWFACALSTGVDSGMHARRFGAALVGVAVLSLILAALAGLVSTLATKSGLALAAIIVVLMVPSAMITMAVAITAELERPGVGQAIASAHPFSAVAMLVSGVFGDPPAMPALPQPEGWLIGVAVLVCLAWVVLPTLALVARMRSVAAL